MEDMGTDEEEELMEVTLTLITITLTVTALLLLCVWGLLLAYLFSGGGFFFYSHEETCDCESMQVIQYVGGRGGSIGRASASRSNGFRDQRFESCPEHKKNL